MKKRFLFIDGNFVRAEKTLENALAPAKLKSAGVFETMLSGGEKIFFLKEHLRRLSRGLKFYKIRSPFSLSDLEKYSKAVVRLNKHKHARVRLMIWKEGADTHTAITAIEHHPLSRSKYDKGFNAVIASERCPATRRKAEVKSLLYQPYMSAFQQASAKGFEEAILLNSRGELAEGSRTNIFFIQGGKLFTPALECGCLNGIIRQTVLNSAQKLKIPCTEGRFKPGLLQKADEAFVSNSIFGIIPLRALNRSKIKSAKAGSLTRKLMKAYHLQLSHS